MIAHPEIALALRHAAAALDHARELARSLPPGCVDEQSAWVLAFYAPAVGQTLCDVAGSIDPEGCARPDPEDSLGELDRVLRERRAV